MKKPSIKQLMRVCEKYKANLLNRNILLVGIKGDEVDQVELRFLARNFKHLTGIKTVNKDLKGNQFWKMCVNHRLSERDIEFDVKGIANQKLAAADRMFEPNVSMRGFGSPNGARLNVEVELYAGNHRACMGFSNFEAYYLDPRTMLESPVEHEVLPEDKYRVVAVYSKGLTERAYRSALRLDEKADWDNVERSLPEGLRYVTGLEVMP